MVRGAEPVTASSEEGSGSGSGMERELPRGERKGMCC